MAEPDSKPCSKCGQLLPLSAFNRVGGGKDILRADCRSCRKEYLRAYREARSPEVRERQMNASKERCRLWYQANQRRWCAHVRAYQERRGFTFADQRKQWAAENPEEYRVSLRAASARRRSRCKDIKTADLSGWLKRQKLICHWCGAKCADDYQIDHIMPLARGGKHEFKNLCIACSSCNRRKHARHPIEFAQSLGKLL